MMSAVSPWIARLLTRYPLLLDELLDPRRLYAPLKRDKLEAELSSLMANLGDADLEQQMERLRQFAQSNMLRVASADVTGAIPLMVVSDFLTEIAEVSVSRVLDLTFRHLNAKHGDPGGIEGDGTGFLVLGYGKLGGIELGYGSDLDLVFLHGSDSVSGMTSGARSISNDQFYLRLGQRMIHVMTTQTASGQLYEVDMRLRPDGSKGMLVRSLRSFSEYQARDAWTWEHQALVRARAVAGDPLLAERFARVRREILCMDREPAGLRDDVREMREKMRGTLDKTRGGRFDLKQGRGGIADIEFMVQYSVLRWASRHPDLAVWTDNVRLLEPMPRPELLERIARADVCILPSLLENYPNTCIEAMSAARVVLGSRHGGMAEMIEHGVSGFLVDGCSSDDIVRVVREDLAIFRNAAEPDQVRVVFIDAGWFFQRFEGLPALPTRWRERHAVWQEAVGPHPMRAVFLRVQEVQASEEGA